MVHDGTQATVHKLELLTSLENKDHIDDDIYRKKLLLLGDVTKPYKDMKKEVHEALKSMLIEVDVLIREKLEFDLDVVNNIEAQKLKMLGRGIVMAGNVVSLILLPITLGGSIALDVAATVVGYAIVANGVYVYKSKTKKSKEKYQSLYKRLEEQVTKYTDSWTHLLDSLGLDPEDYENNPKMFQNRLTKLNDKLEEIEDNSNLEDSLSDSEFIDMIPGIKNIFTRMRQQSRDAVKKFGPANVNVDQLNPAVIALVDNLGEKISDVFQNADVRSAAAGVGAVGVASAGLEGAHMGAHGGGAAAAAAAASSSTAGTALLSKVLLGVNVISFIVNAALFYNNYKEKKRLQKEHDRLQNKEVLEKLKAWDENEEGKRAEISKEYEHYNLLREAIHDVMGMLV